MDNYEKNVAKAVNAVEKVAGVANRVYLGCTIILANLFFAGFCLWGIYTGYISWKLENQGGTATGIVVRLEESDGSEGGCCVYSPVIEFMTNNDQTYLFEGDTASYPPAYEVGQAVPVYMTQRTPTPRRSTNGQSAGCFPSLLFPS